MEGVLVSSEPSSTITTSTFSFANAVSTAPVTVAPSLKHGMTTETRARAALLT
jgi:hypothetical protein